MLRLLTGILTLSFVLVGSSTYADDNSSEKIKLKHRAELFYRGTVTDAEGRTWDVVYLPGVVNPTKKAGENWKAAGRSLKKGARKSKRQLKNAFTIDLETLPELQFYKDLEDITARSLAFTESSVTDFLIKGIADDWRTTREKNRGLKRSREKLHLLKRTGNNAWFGVKALYRGVTTPVRVVLGAASTIAAGISLPVISLGYYAGKAIIYRPTAATVNMAWGIGEALFDAGAKGTIVPAVLYIYNGAAWIPVNLLSINDDLPNRESKLIVLKSQNKKFVIDDAGLAALVAQAIARDSRTADRRQDAQLAQRADERIQEIQRDRKMDSSEFDQKALEELVSDLLGSASEERVKAIAQDVMNSVEKLLKKGLRRRK